MLKPHPAVRFGATDGQTPATPSKRRSTSLAANLVVLVTVVALPLMILGAAALWMQYQTQRANAEAQLIAQAQSTALLIDREFERTLAVAETLAAAVPAAGGDLDAFEAEMRAARRLLERDLPPNAPPPAVSLMDARGSWLLHTNWGVGERRTGLHGTSFGMASVKEGLPKISDLFIAPSSGVPVVGVAVPVFASAPGADGTRATIGGIGISVPRERLLAIVENAGLPGGSAASVLDRKGVIVARSLHDRETVGKLPTSLVLKAVLAADHGVVPAGAETLEGAPSVIAFAHAPFSGFTLKLDVPVRAFLAPLRDAMFHSTWIAAVVLLAGLAMAVAASQRIVRSFRIALGTASIAGNAMPFRRLSGLKEADEFADRLATTFAERERAARSARALIDNSPIGIMIIGGEDQTEQVNDAFLSIVGRDRAGMADAPLGWRDIVPDEFAGAETETLLDWIKSGQSLPYEKEYRRPDGSTVPILISFGLTDPAGGQAAAFLLDLTQQHEAERARHSTEDRLRFAMRAGRLVAWEFDPASGVIHCPTVTSAILGESADEVLTYEQFLAAVHADDRHRVESRIAETLGSGGDYHVEYRLIRGSDQSVHWIESRGRAVREDGKANRLAGISVDVTDRKGSEAALRESEAALRAITDSMPQIVWSTRPDGFNDYYNRRWYDLTGASPEDTKGEGWNGAFHPDDQERAWVAWRHSLATGEPFQIEYRLRLADGSYRWMLGRAEPVRDDATGAIMRWFGTCTDIEDEIAARDALARSRAELEFLVEERTRDLQVTQARLAQAQRMEALGQLAGGIAHDFNNVLQAVQGASALIDRRPADVGGVRRLSRMILDAADRGGAITRRLLAFSRRSDLRAEPVDAVALQTGIRDILSHSLGDGVKVVIEGPTDLPPLMVDKGQLETVLINLATNGRDAMSGIGTLRKSVV